MYKSEKSEGCVVMVGGGGNIVPVNITEIYEHQRASAFRLNAITL